MVEFGYFVCILGYAISCLHAATLSFIKPCKLEDSGCLLTSAQSALPHLAPGVPEHGIDAFEPLSIDNVRGDQGDLLLEFRDLKIKRLSECKFNTFQYAKTDGMDNITFSMDCPITAVGKYKAGGKLMFIAIEGDGNFELATEKIGLTAAVALETNEGSDGKKHWHINKVDYFYTPEERIYIKLDNLFNGDEARAKPILEILNHSWKELILEIGKPIIDQLVLKIKDNINEFLVAAPLDELILQ